ncbi:MAG TPA: aminoacetone oxidase family FAD-binding enzyme [Anaerolineaceae bacterium]|nr:aminoacetone oxidase family FAD-binding enzyme [Anaerolineaceae bacterium]
MNGYNLAMDIGIIGAGASGIFAALTAAQGGAHVTLFDHNAEIGKKLLVTGSGRCNLTNAALSPEKYSCADTAWMQAFLHAFPLQALLAELDTLGIPTHHSDDGWYYPLSDSAHSVVDILRQALLARGVELCLSTEIVDFWPQDGGFVMRFPSGEPARTQSFDKLVVAAGGKAYPALGSRGELFPTLARLGHTVVPLVPALGPLTLQLGAWKTLQGLRFDVNTGIWAGQELLGESFGNVIFTAWGLNGPGVMNLSHLAARQPSQKLNLSLDFGAAFREEFERRLSKDNPANLKAVLEAFFPPKAAEFFLAQVRIPPEARMRELSRAQAKQLESTLRDTRLPITGTKGFDQSQVSAGGVPVGEVDPLTCQSRRIPGLYLVGETLDVVGPCGGYNLHFAFGSGYLAGRDLAKSTQN